VALYRRLIHRSASRDGGSREGGRSERPFALKARRPPFRRRIRVDRRPRIRFVPAEPEPGVELGTYRIDRPLGRGGMGAVFLAHDATLHRPVALKVLESSPDGETARTRLLREARNAAALNHPNICTIYEVGEAAG